MKDLPCAINVEEYFDDTTAVSYTHLVLVEVEFNNEVLASVDEIERECEERLGWQRANFPRGLSGVRAPHVVFEDKGSSRGCVGDMVDVYKRQTDYLLFHCF